MAFVIIARQAARVIQLLCDDRGASLIAIR